VEVGPVAARAAPITSRSEARRGLGRLSYLLMAVPVLLDYWYVHAFGVNVPFEDSWNGTLPIVKAIASGHFYFAQLYAPHNESRTVFPNLILGIMDSHTQANAKFDMYLTAGIMTISLVLLIWLARRSTGLPALLLVPLAFLLFDWVQVENLLWAFQLAWMLVVLCLFVSLAAFERRPHPGWFAVAAGAALVASFSLLQGFLIWPVGLAYAAVLGWRRGWLAVWGGLGVMAAIAYLQGFGSLGASSGLTYDLQHPAATSLYLLRLVGGMVPTSHHATAGLLILGASALVGYLAIRNRIPVTRLRLPLALWATGILFDLLVAAGRTQLAAPASSRYTTFNLLLLAGLYLASVAILVPAGPWDWNAVASRLHLREWEAAIGLLIVLGTVGTVALSVPSGLRAGQAYYSYREHGALLLRDYHTTSAPSLAQFLFAPSGAYVKIWAGWLQSRHWSVFS